jgi:hypothetical protein
MELELIQPENAVTVFTGGGLGAVLDKIEATVRAIPLDCSTAAGRDHIRSVAYRVARTKTTLDAEGKKLTEEWRKNTQQVNVERKKLVERLDALAEEVRKPLTDFENKEKRRIAAHEEALGDLEGLLPMLQNYPDMSVKLLEEHLIDFSGMQQGRDWEEFTERVAKIRHETSVYLIGRIESRKKYDAEQAELARLRQAEAERLQRERDEAIARQAAETARIQAERKAQEEAEAERRRVAAEAEAERKRVAAEAEKARLEHERLQREAREAAEKIKRDHERAQKEAEDKRLAEERAKVAAEKRAKEAEEARIASERKAVADKKAAEDYAVAIAKKAEENKVIAALKAATDLKAAQDQAKRDAETAAKREREKIVAEQKAAEDARLKREADDKHKAKIQSEIIADLMPLFEHYAGNLFDEGIVDRVSTAIMAGKIRHVRVDF